MARDMPPDLRDLADLQRGVITRRQAKSAGLSDDAIRARLGNGAWQRLHAGVYATSGGSPGRQATLWAAVLRSGPGAILSHHTAAELDRLVDRPAPLVHVTIPANRRVRRMPGIVLHIRLDPDLARHPTRLPPRTRIEETVLDLADGCDDSWDAIGWITAALGRRLTTASLLREALGQRPRFRWRARVTQVLTPDMAGIHSALEYGYARDVERPHGLPPGVRQARVRRGSVSEYRDVLYEEFALAVELDGRIAHPDDTLWRDIHRDNAAAARGVITLRYGYREVTTRPCQVAMEVAEALRLRGWRGRLRPCSPQCQTRAVS